MLLSECPFRTAVLMRSRCVANAESDIVSSPNFPEGPRNTAVANRITHIFQLHAAGRPACARRQILHSYKARSLQRGTALVGLRVCDEASITHRLACAPASAV